MRIFRFPRTASIVLPVLAAVLLADLVPSRPPSAGAADAKGTGAVEARILALGVPVPGIAVQVRSTAVPGTDEWLEDPTAPVDTSDAKGRVQFSGLQPGRYHVVGHCGRLPGDFIAGSIATRVEVLPGSTAHTTLTLRRGGRILGRTMLGDVGLGGVSLRIESSDALPSICPMLEPRNPDPDGRFTVGKVPIGTFVQVKAIRPLGRGEVEVWKDFNLAQAETVTGTWNFPPLDSTQLGAVRIGVRLEHGAPADRGRLELQHLDQGWRYRLGFDFTEADSLTLLSHLPPGEYSVRAMAIPGVKVWWNATADTLVVAPGSQRDKIISARLRQ